MARLSGVLARAACLPSPRNVGVCGLGGQIGVFTVGGSGSLALTATEQLPGGALANASAIAPAEGDLPMWPAAVRSEALASIFLPLNGHGLVQGAFNWTPACTDAGTYSLFFLLLTDMASLRRRSFS